MDSNIATILIAAEAYRNFLMTRAREAVDAGEHERADLLAGEAMDIHRAAQAVKGNG